MQKFAVLTDTGGPVAAPTEDDPENTEWVSEWGLPVVREIADRVIRKGENGPVWISDLSEQERQEIGLASLSIEDVTGYHHGTPQDDLDPESGVTRTYPEKTAIPVTAERVKAEAYRRIIGIVPEWKQRNLTARATVLLKKGEANWSEDEAAEWAAGEAIWAQVDAIRDASDTLEGKSPIPQDFTDDRHWTEVE